MLKFYEQIFLYSLSNKIFIISSQWKLPNFPKRHGFIYITEVIKPISNIGQKSPFTLHSTAHVFPWTVTLGWLFCLMFSVKSSALLMWLRYYFTVWNSYPSIPEMVKHYSEAPDTREAVSSGNERKGMRKCGCPQGLLSCRSEADLYALWQTLW